MNRKDFLKNMGYLAAGAASVAMLQCSGSNRASKSGKKLIGIQIYSVRQLLNRDLAGTLKGLADCGYRAIETFAYNNGRYFNNSIEDFDKMVRDTGMKITSAHLGANYNPENITSSLDAWKETADKHKAIGCNTLVIPALPTYSGVHLETAYMDGFCDFLNKVNAIAAERGMRAGFHNHAGDEQRMHNGKAIIDYLFEKTDPTFFVQLDNHNMMTGGRNVIEFIHQYKSRIKQLHVKDDDIVGASGKIDFKELFTVAARYKIYEPIVEVESYPIDMMECMCKSFDYLNAAPYVTYKG
jgi:sugar phosphate isomerase/epimerase